MSTIIQTWQFGIPYCLNMQCATEIPHALSIIEIGQFHFESDECANKSAPMSAPGLLEFAENAANNLLPTEHHRLPQRIEADKRGKCSQMS